MSTKNHTKDGAGNGMPERPAAATRLVHEGRDPAAQHGFVNTPVYRGSTVIYEDTQALRENTPRYVYGRKGTPTTDALCRSLADLDAAEGCILSPSGLAAITTALLAFVKAGDHILITDSVYRPARRFCDTTLAALGVETEYYDPSVGAGIGDLIKPNTRIVYTEAPGSQTMEMQDLPAIVEAVRGAAQGATQGAKQGANQGARALVFNDNTWATPLYFQPLRHGADVAIQAGTKYIVGHSDAMLGVVTANADAWEQLHDGFITLGTNPGSEEVFLGLRGLRTLEVRLERHMRNALEIAAWLQQRPEVEEVLYPALPSSPGHDLWKRDFSGASGLFSVTLRTGCAASLAAMIDGLEYFGIGFSWGGYESLILPFDVSGYRSVRKWDRSKLALRLHIGLEDPGDLKADLEAGFERLKSAG